MNINKTTKNLNILFLAGILTTFILSPFVIAKTNKEKEALENAKNLSAKINDFTYINETELTSASPDDYLKFNFYTGNKVGNVPDLNFEDFKNMKVGCTPICVTNLMQYWSDKGYVFLTSEDKIDTYKEIEKELGSKKDDTFSGKATDPTIVSDKILKYSKSKGYNFESNYYELKNNEEEILDIIKNEIDNKRPVIANISILGFEYVIHTVIITGYNEYFFKLDNNKSISKEIYLEVNDTYKKTKQSFIPYSTKAMSIITFNPKK